jgi:tetratricopeptide (TPR) repeat protein
MPRGARFCGECGQPLDGSDSFVVDPNPSMPAGMFRVPLVHGHTAAQPPTTGVAREAEEEPSLGTLEVDIDLEVEQADAHFQLHEVDALVRRGQHDKALQRLLDVHGLPPGDPQLSERLEQLGRDLGRGAAARARTEGWNPTAMRAELRRLVRLAPHSPYRENVRRELAPAAAEEDVRRARSYLTDGHFHAALSVVEKVLALAPRLNEFRTLQHDIVHAVVARALEEQRAGDAALHRKDRIQAAERYQAALELLENDRQLLARLEHAQGTGIESAPTRTGRRPARSTRPG